MHHIQGAKFGKLKGLSLWPGQQVCRWSSIIQHFSLDATKFEIFWAYQDGAITVQGLTSLAHGIHTGSSKSWWIVPDLYDVMDVGLPPSKWAFSSLDEKQDSSCVTKINGFSSSCKSGSTVVSRLSPTYVNIRVWCSEIRLKISFDIPQHLAVHGRRNTILADKPSEQTRGSEAIFCNALMNVDRLHQIQFRMQCRTNPMRKCSSAYAIRSLRSKPNQAFVLNVFFVNQRFCFHLWAFLRDRNFQIVDVKWRPFAKLPCFVIVATSWRRKQGRNKKQRALNFRGRGVPNQKQIAMDGNGANVIVFTHGRTLERLSLTYMGDIADHF